MKNLFCGIVLLMATSGYSQTLYVPLGTGGIAGSSTANVGIGTNSPQSKLEVRGTEFRLSDLDIRYLSITQDGGGTPYGKSANSATGARQFKFTGWSADVVGGGSSAKDLLHFDGYNLLLLKDNGGSIGIGTAQPKALLDVYTATPTMNTYNTQRWSSGNPAFYLTLKTVWSAAGINYNFIQTENGSDKTSLSFYKGNVGIGTTQPDTRLAVKGSIHAEEVKVDLAVPAPDYVFEKHYNLPTLVDVENFIQQNKHLPEVPSAKQMGENGLNLGEMNILLLKKVEELTLYVIDLKKEVENLKKSSK